MGVGWWVLCVEFCESCASWAEADIQAGTCEGGKERGASGRDGSEETDEALPKRDEPQYYVTSLIVLKKSFLLNVLNT